MSTKDEVQSDRFIPVEVHDPDGQGSVLLEGLRASTSLAEVKGRARVELRLPDDVDWNVRDNATGRLLLDDQRLGQVADLSRTQVELTMQPDAGLG
jgi:hypothetical protein